MNQKSIAYIGGKSGGHIIPALTIARQEQKKNPTINILFFSTSHPLDRTIIHKTIFNGLHIPLPVWIKRGKNPFYFLAFVVGLIYSCFYSLYVLKKNRTIRVVSMGGIVSIPVCFAAKILAIPIEVYELNAIPGRAVTLLAKIATRVHVCFPEAQHYFSASKVTLSSYPLRYSSLEKIFNKHDIAAHLKFDSAKKVVFIVGGSQGSLFINGLIKQWVESYRVHVQALNIIHQTGAVDQTDWIAWYASQGISAHCFSYTPDLQMYYQLADIVICRSGAGTLFECLFFNKRIITIPLQTATTSHQYDNARSLSSRYPDLITLIDQKQLEISPTPFFNLVNTVISQ